MNTDRKSFGVKVFHSMLLQLLPVTHMRTSLMYHFDRLFFSFPFVSLLFNPETIDIGLHDTRCSRVHYPAPHTRLLSKWSRSATFQF